MMAGNNQLIVLRILGLLFGLFLFIWAFRRYRAHKTKRSEFILITFIGTGLSMIAVFPDITNAIAGIFSLDNKQFGRLIMLLIGSNFIMWILIFGIRNKIYIGSLEFDLLIRNLVRKEFKATQGFEKIHEITVVIPALNEAENLDYILHRMPKEVNGHPVGVLVVDDGSIDETEAIVNESEYAMVSNPMNRGGGAALRLGYDIASDGGSEIIVTMDADGQHQPEEIENLVRPILSGEYDFVIGSRVLGKHEREGVLRWIGIHVFNYMIFLLAGIRITDCSSGFRAFKVASLKKVLLVQNQFHTSELIIDAAKKRISTGEVPITILKRRSGKSKKGKNLSYGFNFFKTIIKTWLRG